METEFGILPQAASSVASQVDALYIFLAVSTLLVVTLIASLIIYFLIRYRRRDGRDTGEHLTASRWTELGLAAVPLVFGLAVFFWGARLYFTIHTPPGDALEFYVVAKQWMWKIQHPTGQREINQLHVPRGVPVRLTMTSEDVIHSFFVPAFRLKQDVLPGRFVQIWFEATRTGTFHLFCAEYCGTGHSQMTGQVIVLTPEGYERWLATQPAEAPVQAGAMLFGSLGCAGCHGEQDGPVAPRIAGVFGSERQLADGRRVRADANYVRESILEPQAKVVAGYPPSMPSYAGRLEEEQLVALLAYIRDLGDGEAPDAPASPGPGDLPHPPGHHHEGHR